MKVRMDGIHQVHGMNVSLAHSRLLCVCDAPTLRKDVNRLSVPRMEKRHCCCCSCQQLLILTLLPTNMEFVSRGIQMSEQTVEAGWETYWVRRGTFFPVQRMCWRPLTLQAVLADGGMVVEGPGRLWVQAVPTFEMRCSDWTL